MGKALKSFFKGWNSAIEYDSGSTSYELKKRIEMRRNTNPFKKDAEKIRQDFMIAKSKLNAK